MTEDKQYKYTLAHEFKKPTEAYGNETFYYSVKGDDIKEVIADMEKFKKGFPPLTHKEKLDIALKQNSIDVSSKSTEKETSRTLKNTNKD